jgi:hypothetical protein
VSGAGADERAGWDLAVRTLRGGGAGAAGVTRLSHGGRDQRVGGKQMGQFMRRRQARSFLMASRQIACSVHVSGHGSEGLNFALLRPWWRERFAGPDEDRQ